MTTPSDLLSDTDIPHKLQAPLAPRTWFKTGGPAAILAQPATEKQLSHLMQRCRDQGVRTYILGSGANLLVRDRGVDGVVIRLDALAFRTIKTDKTSVTAGPGVDLFTLVTTAAKAGLDGLSHIAGIPASVGGAIRMNAGGSYGDIGEAVAAVQVMSAAGETYTRTRDDLDFTYRSVNIDAPIILETTFDLDPDDPDRVMKRVKEIFLHKKNSQPMGDKSAGCCFKNPSPPQVSNCEFKTAGQLIDQAGLKGHTLGGATVSEIHANFITARPKTPATDIIALMQHVRDVVADRFGIELQREIVIWP